MIDVAIIGAGPAGLYAATHLAHAGLDVHVFEEHAAIGAPTHCTGIVSQELTELVKLPDELVLNQLTRARLHGPLGAHCDLGWTSSAADAIVVIDRNRFDQSLAEVALRAGARLHTSTPVGAVALEARGVRLDVAGTPVRATTCVVAAGVTYRFHRQLGLGLPGDLIHTAQVELDAAPSDTVELHVGRAVAPDGFLWTVPVRRDGRARLKVGVLARGPAALLLQRFLGRPEVRAQMGPVDGVPITRVLPLRPVPKSYCNRVLLVGDAGGFTKPTTGGGIFYSLLTASLAADTLIEAFRAERFDETVLERYEWRWHERLGHELRVGDWLRQLLAKCSDRELERLVLAVAADNVQAVIRQTARFNWHRGVIVALLRQPSVARILFRSLWR